MIAHRPHAVDPYPVSPEVPGGLWESPIPLSARPALPTFPIDALPEWIAENVAAIAEFTQTPPDVAGCVALAALSTAAGGCADVRVRGSWREPVNIFTVVALPPGARKSPVFNAMVEPILSAEKALRERIRPQIVEAELARATARRDADQAAAAAARSEGKRRADAMVEASEAALIAANTEIPVEPILVADDVTAEAAAGLLAEQGGRLAVLSDEGGIFATLAGRYSGGVPNLEVFLKGHAGSMLRVHRRGRPAEIVDKPALTLGLAVQPEVLRDIASMPGFRGRGLLARILYSVPENTVGRRRIGPPPVSEAVSAAYAHRLRTMVLSLAELREPATLALTPEAGELVLELEADTEPKLAPGAAWAHVVDWASKYVGAVVRIAGLLHLAEHIRDGWNRPIAVDTAHQAVALGRYFADHALAAFDSMGTDPLIEDARAVLDWLIRNIPERITKRDLFTGLSRSRFKKAADLDPVLDLLEQHGYLRQLTEPLRNGPGRRPSPVYLVNPALS